MESLGDGQSKEGTLEGFHAVEFCSQRAGEDCAEVVQRTRVLEERPGLGGCRRSMQPFNGEAGSGMGQRQWGWRNKNTVKKTGLGD